MASPGRAEKDQERERNLGNHEEVGERRRGEREAALSAVLGLTTPAGEAEPVALAGLDSLRPRWPRKLEREPAVEGATAGW